MRRKWKAPLTSSVSAISAETVIMGPGAVFVPSKAQRKPSTTPPIGLIPYSVRQGSESKLLGYAMGVANNQN